MVSTDYPLPPDLEAIDRVARAVHLWMRHRQRSPLRFVDDRAAGAAGRGPGRHNLVAGVISGLCEALALDQRCAVLSAYAYALIDDEIEHALAIAYPLLNRQIDARYIVAFEAGRDVAGELIAILRGPETRSAATAGPSTLQ